MKSILPLFILSIVGYSSYAQTIENIDLLNSRTISGTARFTAMGGAFTALGNDFSAMHINPASSAVYRYDNFGTSLRFQGESNKTSFLGRESSLGDFRVLFENIGVVKKFGPKSKYSFAFSYSKLADFNTHYKVSANNPYNYDPTTGVESGFTLGEYWLAAAAGMTVGEMEVNGWLEEASAASADILWTDSSGVVQGFDFVDASSNAYYIYDEKGRLDEYTFNIAGNESDQFYWGIGFGLPNLNYENYTTLSESGYADSSYFSAVDLERRNRVDAFGFNVKAGFIYKPIQELRIGVSYQSPSWYNATEIYTVRTTGFARNGDRLYGNEYIINDIKYGVSTPAIYRAGIAGVFGKHGILSADIEYTNPTKSTINGKNGNNYEIDEDIYQSASQKSLALKFGGELRAGKFFFRGGYQYRKSNFKNETDIKSDLQAYSGGIGYKVGDLSINFSYVQSVYSQTYVVHPYLAYEVHNNNGVENANTARSIAKNDVSKGTAMIGFNVSF